MGAGGSDPLSTGGEDAGELQMEQFPPQLEAAQVQLLVAQAPQL